jgi:tRNA(adenine34) deaminase
MHQALALAQQALELNEVPIGAIVVAQGVVIGHGFNQVRTRNDPSAHAEILALREAALHQNNYRLTDASLICTLEPCVMCVGALVHARVQTLIFAAPEPKTGACGSAFDLLSDPAHNHQIRVEKGVLAEQSGALLRRFFATKR